MSGALLFYTGAAVSVLTLGQVLLLSVTAAQRARFQSRQRALSLELLKAQIAAANALRQKCEAQAAAWNGFRKFTIERKTKEGDNICSFYLRPHDKKAIPAYQPGQFLTFRLNIPGQTKEVIRCYSLSDRPRSDGYRVTIKRLVPQPAQGLPSPGLASCYFHDRLNPGDIVDVKAPCGQFVLDTARQTPVVFIAGGIGITPLLSMLTEIVESGSTRETWFFFGVKNADEHIMREPLLQIARDHGNVRLRVYYSRPGGASDGSGQACGARPSPGAAVSATGLAPAPVEGTRPTGAPNEPNTFPQPVIAAPGDGRAPATVDFIQQGRITMDVVKGSLPSNNYTFYLCGPAAMMKDLTRGLKEWGVPDSEVHFEAFNPESVKQTPTPAPLNPSPATLSVTFSKSGKTVKWNERLGSLLELAEAQGIVMNYGCRAGNCSTCLTAIKSGEVAYLQEPGGNPEPGSCLACVCVPKSDLVLDA